MPEMEFEEEASLLLEDLGVPLSQEAARNMLKFVYRDSALRALVNGRK